MTQGIRCGKMAKCDMGEIHSENVFLRVTYISNGPKELLRKWFMAYLFKFESTGARIGFANVLSHF